MTVLRIEHRVPDFETWKREFDNDPINREQGGVRRYRVLRPVDDPNYAMIDLEFESPDKADEFLSSLRSLWSRMEGTIMMSPQVRITEVIDSAEY